MHRPEMRSIAVLLGLSLVSGAVNAQVQGPALQTAGAATTSLPGLRAQIKLTPTDRARIKSTMDRANTLAQANRIVEAEELYWSVVVEQRRAGEYPGEALRQLAKLYFLAGSSYATANLLSELAESASEFGDPQEQLRALFEAALLYQQLGRGDRVAQCVERLLPLLKSPAIPDSVRLEIASRVLGR